MTQYISKKVKGFLATHFPGHILMLVFLWIISSFKAWIIFLIMYSTIIIVAFIHEVFRAWRIKRERIYANEVRRLMFLLRHLIDLAFIHDENPVKFYDKFIESITISSLRKFGVIEPDALLRTPKYNRMCKQMKPDDVELWTLIMAGFSNRELKVIYGMTNINSVYIKRYRLKSRLDKQMQNLIGTN